MGRRRRRPGRRPFFSSYTVLTVPCTRCGRGSNKASPLLSPRSRQCSVQQRRRRNKDADVHHQRKSRSTPFLLRLKIYRLSFFSFRSQSKRKGGPRATRQGSKGARRVGEGRENKAKRNLHCQGLSVWLPSVCAPRKEEEEEEKEKKREAARTCERANDVPPSPPLRLRLSFLFSKIGLFFLGRKGRRVGGGGGERLGGGGEGA